MNNQSLSLSGPAQYEQDTLDDDGPNSDASTHPPVNNGAPDKRISAFWRNRCIEVGLIVSMALYYVIGNQNLGMNPFSQVNPLFSLPFLLLFAVLCWYRLPIALALLPLSLPYYLLQKTVLRIAPNHNVSFSLAEITLGVCVLVALIQLFRQRRKWPYWLAWRDLRDRVGPFLIPILVFFAVAAFSIVIAYNKVFALRAFREEVLDPLVYLFLALCCLRSRGDIRRLLGALLASGLIVALLGVVQFHFFKSTLVLESDGIRRVHVMYGSANSIGLFVDYVLPIGLALAVAGFVWHGAVSWWWRLLAIGLCLPLLYVLYLSQSMGAWVAIGGAVLFIGVSSIRNRKVLLISIASLSVVLGIALFFYHTHILNLLFATHVDIHHVSTVTKNVDPVTRISTDLKYEPYLSHPHNVLLHIWVSMGIFGVLAFIAILVLFFWLFVRILRYVRANESSKNLSLQWMTLGVAAAMLAAMVQGLGDSAFLEQDLAFCFWMLIAAMLVLRKLSGTPWRGKVVIKS